MNMVPGIQAYTADGDLAVGVSGQPIRVFSVELISGATASTFKLYNGTTTGGTLYAQVDGVASKSVVSNYAGGKLFPNGCFGETDANIGTVTVVFAKEN